MEFKAAAGWRHTAHTSILGSTRETTRARICRPEPRHAAVRRSSGSARGAEGRGRWGKCGEAPGFGPSALALAQDPVERVIRFQIRRPRIKAAQIWRARSGLHRQRCRAGSVSGGVPPPAGLRRKKHASVQRARRAAHSYKRCQSAGSSPPGGTETGAASVVVVRAAPESGRRRAEAEAEGDVSARRKT